MKKRPTKSKIYQCTENDNRLAVQDGRESGDGIELHVGSCLESQGFHVVGLKDLQAAFSAAGVSPVAYAGPPATHERRGRREPYTEAGIRRLPCYRCGDPADFQWNICADGMQRPVCRCCDIELNRMVMDFMGDPDAKKKILWYVAVKLPNPITDREVALVKSVCDALQ